jgi:mRNA interferase MazF
MPLQKGDIVLVPFPFTNLSQTKLRPAVVLWSDNAGQDVTLCFVSSQNMETLKPEEFILDSNDSEFLGTGLKVASKIKVARIATLERRLITSRLGQLGTNQIQQLKTILKQVFQLN